MACDVPSADVPLGPCAFHFRDMALPAQTSLLRRIIVGVALLGVLVVTHLWLQSLNGFANGCSGLAPALDSFDITEAATTTSGCANVTTGPYSTFLGVSNILWGFLFYGLLSLLRFGYALTANDRLRLASFGLVGIGMGYTAYLVYLQVAVIQEFCVLCMTSAVLVTTLLILHILEHRKVNAAGPEPRRGAAEPVTGMAALRPYVPILGLFVVLLGADVVLAQRGGPDDTANDTKIPLNQLAAAGAQANAQNVDTGRRVRVRSQHGAHRGHVAFHDDGVERRERVADSGGGDLRPQLPALCGPRGVSG